MSYPQKPTPHKTCAHCGRRMQRKRYGKQLETLAKFNRRRYCGPWCAKEAQKDAPEPLPLAAQRPRQGTRRSDSHLTLEQIRAAYRLYQAGLSMNQLGAIGWRKWGYTQPKHAATALHRAFTLEGFKLRDKSQASLLRYQAAPCGGCGGPMDGRTKGCDQCRKRDNARRARELQVAA